MSTGKNTKVRLVKCPRCRQLLPELADVPVYKCGGCNTVLQAKCCKNDIKNTRSSSEETDIAHVNELERVSEDKASSSSSQKSVLLAEECLSDQNNGSNQNESGDCIREQPGSTNFSNELSSSAEPSHDNDESSSVAGANSEVDESGDCNTEQVGSAYFSCELSSSTELSHKTDESSLVAGANSEVVESGDCNREQPGSTNFSNELSSSTELSHENDESSSVAGANSEIDESGDCNREQPGSTNFSVELSSSTELSHENDESSLVAGANSEVDESGDCNREQPGSANFSNELSSSTELSHENDESSLVAVANSEVDEPGYCNMEQPGGIQFPNELSSSPDLAHENDQSSPIAEANSKVDEKSESWLNVKRSSTDYLHSTTGKSSIITPIPQESVPHGFDRVKSTDTLGTTEWIAPCSELSGTLRDLSKSPTTTSYHAYDGSVSSFDGIDDQLPDQRLHTFKKNYKAQDVVRNEGRPKRARLPVNNMMRSNLEMEYHQARNSLSVSSDKHHHSMWDSDDTLEHTRQGHPGRIRMRSERAADFVRTVERPQREKFPVSNMKSKLEMEQAARNSYSISSNRKDQNVWYSDDSLEPTRHAGHPVRSQMGLERAAECVRTEERLQRDKFMKNNKIRNNSEMEYQAMNSSSISSKMKHQSMWDSDDTQESTRHGHPVRNHMRMERDEFPPRVPFYARGSQPGYDNGSHSSHGRNDFQSSLSYHSPENPEYPEQEKIKLIKMVYELQDRIERTRIANGRVPVEVAWKEKQNKTYYNHRVCEEENFHDLNHPMHHRERRQGENWSQPCRVSRMPLSGEVTGSRLQASRICMNSCPQDWNRSAQLPPSASYYNKGLCRVHPGQNCYCPYSSNSSSPSRYANSEFSSWNPDTKSGDQRHKDHAMKFYVKEKHHLVKRHFRPMAGGAPFIICYHCSELLQLPSDFLLFKRRCHQLRCSSCSKVLKFSLENGTRIVRYRYTSCAVDPPPSVVDDNGDVTNVRNLASASQANGCPHLDPVAYSDDYGPSVCRSCSTGGESVSLERPINGFRGSAYNRKMSSGSSLEPMMVEKKPVWKQPVNKYKTPVETYESAESSSNMKKFSSEIEELPPTSGSPLHRLMGYSSPREVIYN